MSPRRILALAIIVVGVALTVWSVTGLISEGGGGLLSYGVALPTLLFYAFAIPTVIHLLRLRKSPATAPVGTSVGDIRIAGQRPRRGVTRIGWIALALSVAGPALLYLTSWGFGLSIEYSALGSDRPTDPPLGAQLWEYFLLVWALDVVAAVVVCSVAGTRGLGNRIVGVAGGLILAAPIAVFWIH